MRSPVGPPTDPRGVSTRAPRTPPSSNPRPHTPTLATHRRPRRARHERRRPNGRRGFSPLRQPLEKRTGIDDGPRDETSQTDENDDESGEATPIKTASLARRSVPATPRRAVASPRVSPSVSRAWTPTSRGDVRSEARRSPRRSLMTIRRRPSADDHPPIRPPLEPSAIRRRAGAPAIRLDDAARLVVSHARHAAACAPPPPHHGCARAVPWEPTSGASSTIRAADPDDVAAFGRRYDGNDAWDVRPESFRGDRSAAAAYRLLPPPGDRRFERTRAMARRIFAASRTAVEGYRGSLRRRRGSTRRTNGAPRVAIENAPRTNRDTPARYLRRQRSRAFVTRSSAVHETRRGSRSRARAVFPRGPIENSRRGPRRVRRPRARY